MAESSAVHRSDLVRREVDRPGFLVLGRLFVLNRGASEGYCVSFGTREWLLGSLPWSLAGQATQSVAHRMVDAAWGRAGYS